MKTRSTQGLLCPLPSSSPSPSPSPSGRPSSRRAGRLRALALLALAAGALGGCDRDPAGPSNSLPDVASVEVVDSLGPILRLLEVELEEAAAVEVYYEPVDGGRALRMRSDEVSRSHEVLVPRLLADTAYRYVVRSYAAGGVSGRVERGTFETGSLPTGLANLDLAVEGEGTFDLLLFWHQDGEGFGGLLGIEPDGAVVWYTTEVRGGLAPTPIPGSHDIAVIGWQGVDGLARISPRGHVLDSVPDAAFPDTAPHHDLAALDDHRIAMIIQDARTVRDTVVQGEAVWIWDTSTGGIDKVWSAWDHFDWDFDRGARSQPSDWLHANALSVGPRGNLIMSLHFLNQVISIAPDYESVEWRLGGVNATIPVVEEDRFEGQHSAFQLDNDHVLLFDNQYRDWSAPPAEYSRGLELEIEGDSASAVWRYVPDPPVWARIISGIYPLENGHRVITFSSPPDLFTVHEADAAGQRVWRLTGENLVFNFRAVPWPSIAGEERVIALP